MFKQGTPIVRRGEGSILDGSSKILSHSSTMVNQLGQEMSSVGRALGGEEAAAAFNIVGMSGVMMLGVGALAAGVGGKVLSGKPSDFFSKWVRYGGVGMPMDKDGRCLQKMMNGMKLMSSAEAIQGLMSTRKDRLVTRELHGNMWQTMLFLRTCSERHAAIGLDGDVPPMLDLDMSQFGREDRLRLMNNLRHHGFRVTDSLSDENFIHVFGTAGQFLSAGAKGGKKELSLYPLAEIAKALNAHGKAYAVPLELEYPSASFNRLKARLASKGVKLTDQYGKEIGTAIGGKTAKITAYACADNGIDGLYHLFNEVVRFDDPGLTRQLRDYMSSDKHSFGDNGYNLKPRLLYGEATSGDQVTSALFARVTSPEQAALYGKEVGDCAFLDNVFRDRESDMILSADSPIVAFVSKERDLMSQVATRRSAEATRAAVENVQSLLKNH